MSWESSISAKANNLLFKAAWNKAQRVRTRVEKLLEHFFEELVTVGIDVMEPPDLGSFTPTWEPLSESWIERKHGDDSFYRGVSPWGDSLQYILGRKNTTSVFGRPQVFLDWNGGSKKVNAGAAAQKYSGTKLTSLKIRVIPFPKVGGNWTGEELVAGGNDRTFFKLVNPKGQRLRPLVTPFINWYVSVKVKKAMKGLVA